MDFKIKTRKLIFKDELRNFQNAIKTGSFKKTYIKFYIQPIEWKGYRKIIRTI